MNTATGAVTEYDWTFQSITPEHAGSAAGLFTLGGNTDAGVPIAAELRSGRPEAKTKQAIGNVYLVLEGAGDGTLIVEGRSDAWEYPMTGRASGVSRAKPGRGISETRLGFGFRNAAGADFRLDRIDAEILETKTRRN